MFSVNLATGELCLSLSEVFLAGPLAVDFTRQYLSSRSRSGALGPGWTHPYEIVLTREGNELVLRKSGDEQHRFSGSDDGGDESEYVLERSAKTWRVTDTTESRDAAYTTGNVMEVSLGACRTTCNAGRPA